MRALDHHRRVTAVPFQDSAALAELGLTVAEAEAAAWAITPRGGRYRGAAAIDLAVAVALGSRLPIWLYLVPGLRTLQDRVYDWVARNRHHLPGDQPFCEQYPAECG